MNEVLGVLIVKELSSSAESTEEMALLRVVPKTLQSSLRNPCNETSTYVFAIAINNMVSSMSHRDVWPSMCSAVEVGIYGTFLDVILSLLILIKQ